MILEDINEFLNFLNPNKKDYNRCNDAMKSIQLSVDHIKDVLYWHPEYYTRNLLSRTEIYEVYICCWLPGQASPVHDVNGQNSWCKIIQGSLELNVFEDGKKTTHRILQENDLMEPLDKNTMYSLSNTQNVKTISLHLVSLPVNTFSVNNQKTNDVEWVQKYYHTINGTIIQH